MNVPEKQVLLLALGNDIMGDDGAGWLAARALQKEFPDFVHIEESGEAGLALLEKVTGFKRVLLLDAVVTGRVPPGSVLEFSPRDFPRTPAPSPHWIGIPGVFDVARQLQIPMAEEFRILALEVEDPYEVRTSLTASVQKAMPDFIRRAGAILEEWLDCAVDGKTIGN